VVKIAAQMEVPQLAISKANADHYAWGQGCDGWYLVKNDQMTIIHERMPPGTAETLHQHAKARQFFFILAGVAVMEHGGVVTTVSQGAGLEVPPGVPHRILNEHETDLEFLVTSVPPSHADRVAVGHGNP
jgi:mannose-6-phosphate isomerase-like protein (cupin superfamily)